MRQGGEGAHRFPEAETELQQVGEVSLAGRRAAGHSCWRKATSVRGVRYYNLQAQPVKWPSVDGLLIYRPFSSTAHHYLINANEPGHIPQLQRRWGSHSFSSLQRALTPDDFTFRARHWFGWKSPSLAKDWVRPRGGFGSGSPPCDGQITKDPPSRALGCCPALLSWLLAHGAASSLRGLGTRASPKHSLCKCWKNKQLKTFPGESRQASQTRRVGLCDLISSYRKPTVQPGN